MCLDMMIIIYIEELELVVICKMKCLCRV